MRHVPHASKFAVLVLAAFAAGCHGEDCHGCGYEGDPFVYEDEPNDQACCANDFGTLAPYESLAIRGSLPASVPDFFDGFAFHSAQAIDVRVELVSDDPHADFDLCIYDPLIGDYVACFETGAHPEVGLFSVLEAGREFHVVVTPYSGTGGYTLYVDAFPISLAAPATEGGAITAEQQAGERRERAHDLADYHPEVAVSAPAVERLELAGYTELIEVDDRGEVRRTRLPIVRPTAR
ncbi:MAG: hypothetical protein IT453_05785 [Planctomycetes bacterium]|nr:hypothetical protein [Planctomycetota bacterium]